MGSDIIKELMARVRPEQFAFLSSTLRAFEKGAEPSALFDDAAFMELARKSLASSYAGRIMKMVRTSHATSDLPEEFVRLSLMFGTELSHLSLRTIDRRKVFSAALRTIEEYDRENLPRIFSVLHERYGCPAAGEHLPRPVQDTDASLAEQSAKSAFMLFADASKPKS